MPSTALSVLLPDLARYIGLYATVNTTTNLTTSNDVVSTGFTDLGFSNDDMLNNLWLRIRGTNNDRVARLIDDYTGSSGTATVRGTNLAADTGAQAVDIYPCDPRELINALNLARTDVRKWVYKESSYVLPTLRDLSTFRLPSGLFVGRPSLVRLVNLSRADVENENLLKDRDPEFDTVDGTLWIGSNMTTGTTIASSSSPFDPVVLLSDSAGDFLTDGGSSAATVLNTIQQATRGREMGFELWVYCITASRLTIQILDGTTTSNSGSHQGVGWERLQVRGNIIGSASPTVKVGISDATNASGLRYFADKAFAVRGPLESVEYRTYNYLTDFNYIEPEGPATDGFLLFKTALPQKMALEIVGKTSLSSVSAEADTMELDAEQALLLYAATVRRLPRSQAQYLAAAEIDYDDLQAKAVNDLNTTIETLKSRGEYKPSRVNLNWGA